MDIFQDIVKKNIDFLETIENFHNDTDKTCDGYFKEIDNFLSTGSIDFFKTSMTGKENVEPIIPPTIKRKGRQKKPALADITEVNTPLIPVDIKKEKISGINGITKDIDVSIFIKKEVEEMPAPTRLPPRKKKIKSEKIEMPKRSTRSRTRTKNLEIEDTCDRGERKDAKKTSDVIIQNTTITTIEISDSEKDTETESEVEKNIEVRTTRSKMRKPSKQQNTDETKNVKNAIASDGKSERSTRTKRKKRARSDSVDEPTIETESKKSKSHSGSEKECNGSVQTEYEDAVSLLDTNQNIDANKDINATYIASSKDSQGTSDNASSINSTVIVENPKIVMTGTEQDNKRSKNESEKASPIKKTKGASKQIFSPYENTPLKKKVEAFERLGGCSSIPTRVTRTKKKVQKKDSVDNTEDKEEKPAEKDKYKGVCTPIMTKFQSKGSTSKINKVLPHYSNDTSTYNESVLTAKSASALKASQAEFREREKRRQEKEQEVLKKREALLQAQTEEKRRKREEKQQKAQQQRELLEKEKQKHLEMQRLKEEKYKQVMAEREEKLQKQKEEAEKKRVMAKKKAEMQKEEGFKKYTEMKATMDKQSEISKLVSKHKMERQQQQQHSMPIYMVTRPPLLPTDDCYDSDDPEFEVARRNEPYWSRDPDVKQQQMTMIICGESIKNSFFCRQAHTPDLIEIFEHIDPRKLKRTSSAIWRKAPRYTLMPTFAEEQPVFSEESD